MEKTYPAREPLKNPETERALHTIHASLLELLAAGDDAEIQKLIRNLWAIQQSFRDELEMVLSENIERN